MPQARRSFDTQWQRLSRSGLPLATSTGLALAPFSRRRGYSADPRLWLGATQATVSPSGERLRSATLWRAPKATPASKALLSCARVGETSWARATTRIDRNNMPVCTDLLAPGAPRLYRSPPAFATHRAAKSG